ncbi:hypothetical protein GCM10010335_68090 [Streptomyces galbus]|nr:hypothetical protein GCM10010335_68090 [Streptomyces galbus]
MLATAAADEVVRYLGLQDCAALPAGMLTAWAWKPTEGFGGLLTSASGVTVSAACHHPP